MITCHSIRSSRLPLSTSAVYTGVMRNLSLSSYETLSVSGANFSSTALDLDQNVLYVASERQNFDADTEVEIWRIELDSTGAIFQVVIAVFRNMNWLAQGICRESI